MGDPDATGNQATIPGPTGSTKIQSFAGLTTVSEFRVPKPSRLAMILTVRDYLSYWFRIWL